jgi:hypothetical protein
MTIYQNGEQQVQEFFLHGFSMSSRIGFSSGNLNIYVASYLCPFQYHGMRIPQALRLKGRTDNLDIRVTSY